MQLVAAAFFLFSFPIRATGIVATWIGVGIVKPSVAITFSRERVIGKSHEVHFRVEESRVTVLRFVFRDEFIFFPVKEVESLQDGVSLMWSSV